MQKKRVCAFVNLVCNRFSIKSICRKKWVAYKVKGRRITKSKIPGGGKCVWNVTNSACIGGMEWNRFGMEKVKHKSSQLKEKQQRLDTCETTTIKERIKSKTNLELRRQNAVASNKGYMLLTWHIIREHFLVKLDEGLRSTYTIRWYTVDSRQTLSKSSTTRKLIRNGSPWNSHAENVFTQQQQQ